MAIYDNTSVILKRSGSLLNRVAHKTNMLAKDVKRLEERSNTKYVNFAEMQASGVLDSYLKFQSRVINTEEYKLNNSLTKVRLDQESNALENMSTSINSAILELSSIPAGGSNESKFAKVKEDTINNTLKEIEIILNTKAATGDYLFGGIRSNTPPCKSLQVSNFIDGKSTTNYTDAVAGQKITQISRLHQVKMDLCADNGAFAEAIGTLNSLKAQHSNTNSYEATLGKLRGAVGQIRLLQADVKGKHKMLEAAEELNGQDHINAIDGADEINKTQIEEFGAEFKSLQTQLLFNTKLQVAISKLIDESMNNLSNI